MNRRQNLFAMAAGLGIALLGGAMASAGVTGWTLAAVGLSIAALGAGAMGLPLRPALLRTRRQPPRADR